MNASFAGKRILITGGAAGIGLALALKLRSQGATVAVGDVDEDALARGRTARPDMFWDRVDFAEPDQIGAWVASASDGGIDVLVNNVGLSGPVAPIATLPPADWRRLMTVNLDAAFLCTQAAIPLLRKPGGAILNISSIAAKAKPPERAAYVVSKAGLEALTLVTAQELGSSGIRVNAIRPGMVDNPRWRNLLARTADQQGVSKESLLSDTLERVSLRIVVSEEQVADLALFLVSEAADAISGQIVAVDGHVQLGP